METLSRGATAKRPDSARFDEGIAKNAIRNLSVKPIGIEAWWGPPHLDQPGRSLRLLPGPASWMPENPPRLVGILDDVDLFFAFGQRFVARTFLISAMLIRGLPPLRCPHRNPKNSAHSRNSRIARCSRILGQLPRHEQGVSAQSKDRTHQRFEIRQSDRFPGNLNERTKRHFARCGIVFEMSAHSFEPHVGIYKNGSAAPEEAAVAVHLLQVGVGWNGALEYLPLCVDRNPSAGVVDDHVGTYAAKVPERASYLRGNRDVRVCSHRLYESPGQIRLEQLVHIEENRRDRKPAGGKCGRPV